MRGPDTFFERRSNTRGISSSGLSVAIPASPRARRQRRHDCFVAKAVAYRECSNHRRATAQSRGGSMSQEREVLEAQPLLTGLVIGESPRWRDGRLWFAHWGTGE